MLITASNCSILGQNYWLEYPVNDVIGGIIAKTGMSGEDRELWQIHYIAKALGLRGRWLDIGGNIGTHAIAFAASGADSVDSFEMMPGMVNLIIRNLEASRFRHKVLIHQVALGDGHKHPVLEFEGDYGKTRLGTHFTIGASRVQTVRLDDFMGSSARVSLIKVDVEGAEEAVLAGSSNLLSRCRPLVWAECWETDPGKVARVLALMPARYAVAQLYTEDNWLFYPVECTRGVLEGLQTFLKNH